MRLANLDGRAVILTESGGVDVATASEGRFGPDPQALLEEWPALLEWADGAGLAARAPADAAPADPSPALGEPSGARPETPAGPVDGAALGPPVPRPRQIFAVGLNYLDHTAESGFTQPAQPMIFTKFPSCLTGPYGDVVLSSESVDWELELVAVVGRTAHRIPPEAALDHLAGFTIGQDLSDRALQMAGVPPQFSLAKSYPGFGPTGPWLTTLDELDDPAGLTLTCSLNGETVQQASMADMVFPVPFLVSYLSGVCTLLPGDLIFTGTPPGVGMGRTPPHYLSPGDVLESHIDGLGSMRHRLVAGDA